MNIPDSVRESTVEFVADLVAEDPTTRVVRSHTRIDKAIEAFLDKHLKYGEYKSKLRLEYAQKVALALAVGLPKELQTPLNSLGKLRNDFAHELDSALSDSRITALYECLSPGLKDQAQAIARDLWHSHQPEVAYPKFEKLDPIDRFISISVILWNALQSAILSCADSLPSA